MEGYPPSQRPVTRSSLYSEHTFVLHRKHTEVVPGGSARIFTIGRKKPEEMKKRALVACLLPPAVLPELRPPCVAMMSGNKIKVSVCSSHPRHLLLEVVNYLFHADNSSRRENAVFHNERCRRGKSSERAGCRRRCTLLPE